jgi:hypothetical protein
MNPFTISTKTDLRRPCTLRRRRYADGRRKLPVFSGDESVFQPAVICSITTIKAAEPIAMEARTKLG